MPASVFHECACSACRSGKSHPDRRLHRQINLLLSRLDEQQRRWLAALEATRLGRGGVQRMAEVTGLDRHTIARGQRELASGLADRPRERIRCQGGGRPARERQDAGLTTALADLLGPETAGDPMGQRAKCKRRSLRQLSEALTVAGHPASRPTVARLLGELGYSPKANARRSETRSSAERNTQFEHIAAERRRFEAAGVPVISVDSKKKGVDR
jgi:Rhodopirellula transposase DDE domain